MDNVFEIERGTNNVLLIGTDLEKSEIYEVKRDLETILVPKFFDKVILVRGLKGAYHIKR